MVRGHGQNNNSIQKWKVLSLPSFFFVIALVIALSMGGLLGIFGTYALVLLIGTMAMAVLIILRQDELAATIVIAVHLYVDWYLAFRVVSLVMVLVLLVVFFLARSHRHPWIEPPALLLWALFLTLTIYPAINGSLTLFDTVVYYPNVIFLAFLMYWFGVILARNTDSILVLFKILSVFGTLLAVHSIIQAATGMVLFGTTHYDANFVRYQVDTLSYSSSRVGSFFVDPNWNGTFFATIIFLPLSLFVESSAFFGKLFYLAEGFLMLIALLLTYSNGAWVGILSGGITFVIFVGRNRYRVLLPLFAVLSALMFVVLFPSQLALQFQHATNPSELALRVGAWQTAINIISAFPLTGIGLGSQAYLLRAEPFRVPAQSVPLSHPHNSYLEMGAMAGLPVLVLFVLLILYPMYLAFRNWTMADVRTRTLLGGGIAATTALSINSLSINGWTLLPLGVIGWLILGVISSPLISRGKLVNDSGEKQGFLDGKPEFEIVGKNKN